MALVSRNFMIMMAVLVAVLAASALPANKDGDGKGGKGKGKRSAEDAPQEEGGVSALEDSFADALAEDAEAAMMLGDQVRERRAAGEQPPVGAAYVEEDGEVQQADGLSPIEPKKPCKGGRRGGRNGTDTEGDTEGAGGTEDMSRQRQQKKKQRKNKKATEEEPSSLTNWMFGVSE